MWFSEITVQSPLSDATHLSGPGSSVHEAGHVTLAAAAMPVPRLMLPCRFAMAVNTVELTSVSFADHDWHRIMSEKHLPSTVGTGVPVSQEGPSRTALGRD